MVFRLFMKITRNAFPLSDNGLLVHSSVFAGRGTTIASPTFFRAIASSRTSFLNGSIRLSLFVSRSAATSLALTTLKVAMMSSPRAFMNA